MFKKKNLDSIYKNSSECLEILKRYPNAKKADNDVIQYFSDFFKTSVDQARKESLGEHLLFIHESYTGMHYVNKYNIDPIINKLNSCMSLLDLIKSKAINGEDIHSLEFLLSKIKGLAGLELAKRQTI